MVRYNDQKVAKNQARLIHAGNYLQEADKLTRREIVYRFNMLTSLNQAVRWNAIHITMNFAPTENFTDKKLVVLAKEYMMRIGFGDQPFLVYQHLDAGHPHLHLVSTNITGNGDRIDMNLLFFKKVQPARIALEEKYGLLKAVRNKTTKQYLIKPPQRAEYGRSPTRQTIVDVLEFVFDKYRFSSLEDLNAVLELYNIKTTRGHPDGNMFKYHSMAYFMINNNGKQIGLSIKAGSIHFKPDLHYIEDKIQRNKIARTEILRLQMITNAAVRKSPDSLKDIFAMLKWDKIELIPHTGLENGLHNFHLVDLEQKLVINANDHGTELNVQKLSTQLSLYPGISWKILHLSNIEKINGRQLNPAQEKLIENLSMTDSKHRKTKSLHR